MIFAKRLREGVRRGDITLSVRIWQRPHVKVGGRYRMEEGEIEVQSIAAIDFADITPELARRTGFEGVIDLLKTAKHGKGENVYLIRFRYLPPSHGLRDRLGDDQPPNAARTEVD
ncbi:MAG TPA: ASCH domain-containing protein [Thermoanaerobaculia bacterium]|nr:ASCH domain-containing protein [Thermoanaerobaculia bacterium]